MMFSCAAVDALWKIYTTEGVAGLWRSTIPSAVLAVNPAVQFMVYEALKRKLQDTFHSQVIIGQQYRLYVAATEIGFLYSFGFCS